MGVTCLVPLIFLIPLCIFKIENNCLITFTLFFVFLNLFPCLFIFFYFLFFYCSGFCHTLKWISHGFTCVPHPDPPSHLPLHPIPLGLPGPSACLMHPTWAGDLFHPKLYIHVSMLFSWNIPPSPSPTESKRLFHTSVSLLLFCI